MSELVNGSSVEVVRDYEALSQTAARIVLDKITEIPGASLLVPTGTTPEGMYAILSKQPADLFRGVAFYNLDEYCEPDETGTMRQLSPDDKRSYRYYMQAHILGAIPTIKSFFPDEDNIEKPGSYDALIEGNGGIDLTVHSIGRDGHMFGFNIPGSSFESVSRLIELNETTINVNGELTGHDIPPHATTTGMATGMHSRQVITILNGERKADILRQAIWSDVTTDIPATILRTHPNHLYVVDEAAASKL